MSSTLAMIRISVLAVAACGRVGFEERVTDDAAPVDAGPITIARDLPCATQVLLDSGGHNSHDIIRWVFDGEADWIIGADHYNQDDHKIEAHRVASSGGVVTAGDPQLVAQADHVDVLSIDAAANGGLVLGYWDFALGTAWSVAIGSNMIAGSPQALGPLYGGNPPLARIGGGGKLGFAGTIGGGVQLIEVDDAAKPTMRQVQLATPADGPGAPSVLTVDDGLVVAWPSAAAGACKLVKLAPDLSIVAGPVVFGSGGCADPHVAWLATARRIVAVAETAGPTIIGATFTADLVPIDATHVVVASARWPRIVGDGDAAWLTWAEGGPSRVGHALLDATASVVRRGQLAGTIDETLGHLHQIDRVANETVITWTDTAQNRTFSAQRLCR